MGAMATKGPAEPADEVPAWLYTVLVVAGQVIGLSLIIAIGSRDAGYDGLGAYAFACGFGAVLLLRHRWPLAVLVVTVLGIFGYYILGYPPIGMAVPAAAALYATAARGRVVAALVTGGVLLAVSLFFRALHHESSAVLAYDVLTNAALVGCAVALGSTVRGRRRLREQQHTIVDLERAREQERAARDLQAERVRIARDLHDSVGHALSVISVHANVAREALTSVAAPEAPPGPGALGVPESRSAPGPPASPDTSDTSDTPDAPEARDAAAVRSLDRVIEATAASLGDLRSTLSMLRAPGETAGDDRTPRGLDGIDRLAQAARDVGLEAHVSVTTGDTPVPAPVATAAYRIVQEAVTNVLRHASATTLTIDVTVTAGTLRVRVADDGRGADPAAAGGAEPTAGRGLAGMRERAAALGGTCAVAAQPGGGFTVTADLPLRSRP